MKVAFVGKGGSGKTTLAALFCRALAQSGARVLAIDADINQHLGEALGMSKEEAALMPELGNELPRIKAYLRGNNALIASEKVMLKTTPPGAGSNLLRLDSGNPLFAHFARQVAGIQMMRTGSLTTEDIGIKCYHSKTGAVELLLNHMVDGSGEYVIVDMTAGADAFASGIFTRFDALLVVVEPTEKSVSVYEQYQQYAAPYGVQLMVVANKVLDAADAAFIRERVGEPVCSIPASRELRDGVADISVEISEALLSIRSAIDALPRDWTRFKQQGDFFHIKNAESWGNEAVGADVRGQIDESFSYERVQ